MPNPTPRSGSTGITLIVCGGRNYRNRVRVFAVLNAIHAKHPIRTIITGKCKTGADRFAEEWCDGAGIPHKPYPVTDEEWRTIGRRAGPLRNGRMLKENPDVRAVVAFAGGNGTADMVRQAEAAGVETWQPDLERKAQP